MRFFPVLLAILMLAAPGLAQGGGTIERTYEAGTVNVRAEQPEALGLTADGSLDVGGVRVSSRSFPFGARVADIVVRDASSPAVRALACQDLDGDYVCGEARDGEPRIEFCDTLSDPSKVLSDAGVPLRGGKDLVVFVFAGPARVSIASPQATGLAPCPGGPMGYATTGTVTLTLV